MKNNYKIKIGSYFIAILFLTVASIQSCNISDDSMDQYNISRENIQGTWNFDSTYYETTNEDGSNQYIISTFDSLQYKINNSDTIYAGYAGTFSPRFKFEFIQPDTIAITSSIGIYFFVPEEINYYQIIEFDQQERMVLKQVKNDSDEIYLQYFSR